MMTREERWVIILLELNARQPLVVMPIGHDDRHVEPDKHRKQRLKYYVRFIAE
jgi:hypothetical protein